MLSTGRILKALGPAEIEALIDTSAPRFLIPLFLNSLPLDTTMLVLDRFFVRQARPVMLSDGGTVYHRQNQMKYLLEIHHSHLLIKKKLLNFFESSMCKNKIFVFHEPFNFSAEICLTHLL